MKFSHQILSFVMSLVVFTPTVAIASPADDAKALLHKIQVLDKELAAMKDEVAGIKNPKVSKGKFVPHGFNPNPGTVTTLSTVTSATPWLSCVVSNATSTPTLTFGLPSAVSAYNVLGNFTGSTGALTLGGPITIPMGGTGAITAPLGFNALSPMTTLGDIIYGGASGYGTRLAGNTTTTKKFLTQTGTGSVSAAPTLSTIASADVPWTTPGTIGSGTPSTGAFTALSLGGQLSFGATTSSLDTAITRDSAGLLEINNGTPGSLVQLNAATLSASTEILLGNGDTGIARNGANILEVNNGTPGTLAGLKATTIGFNGNITAGTDNTYNIGALGANRPANVYVANTISSNNNQMGVQAINSGTTTLTSTSPAYNIINNTGGDVAINLPAVSTVPGMFLYFEHKTGTDGSKTITITPNGSDTIDGVASMTLDGASIHNTLCIAAGSGATWHVIEYLPSTTQGTLFDTDANGHLHAIAPGTPGYYLQTNGPGFSSTWTPVASVFTDEAHQFSSGTFTSNVFPIATLTSLTSADDLTTYVLDTDYSFVASTGVFTSITLPNATTYHINYTADSGTVSSVGLTNTGLNFITVGGTNPVTSAGSIAQTVTCSVGDLIHGSSANNLSAFAVGTADQILGVTHTGAANQEYKTLNAGTGISITPTAGNIAIANTGVTSVSLNTSSISFLASSSTVTTTGTLTLAASCATGDTFYGSGTNAISTLSAGNNYEILGLASGVPAWTYGLDGITTLTPTSTVTLTNASPSCNTLSPGSHTLAVNLPLASTCPGKVFWLEQIAGSGVLTVTAVGGDTLEGGGTTNVLTTGLPLMLVSAGSANIWRALSPNLVAGTGITLTPGNGSVTVTASAQTLADDNFWVGNISSVPTAVVMSGDATLSDTGALTLATVNTDTSSYNLATVQANGKGLVTSAAAATLASAKLWVGNVSSVPTAVSLSGDATMANTGALTLATVNTDTSSYNLATVQANGKGLVTSAAAATLATGNIWIGNGIAVPTAQTLSGDATLSYLGAFTLANTAVTAGSYVAPTVTFDAKGRATAATSTVNNSVTTIAGSTSGNIYWNQPLALTALKMVIVTFSSFHDSGQTLTFGTAFTTLPALINGTSIATPTFTASTVTIPATTGVTGTWVFIGI